MAYLKELIGKEHTVEIVTIFKVSSPKNPGQTTKWYMNSIAANIQKGTGTNSEVSKGYGMKTPDGQVFPFDGNESITFENSDEIIAEARRELLKNLSETDLALIRMGE